MVVITSLVAVVIATAWSFQVDFKRLLLDKSANVLGEEVEVDLDATVGGYLTPTPISTGGPTATPKNCCAYCWNDADCGGSLHCFNGYCRNPNCITETDCDCSAITPTPSPSPTATTEAETPYPYPSPEAEEGKFIIYGYAPSLSKVNLTGIGVSERSLSDTSGYFEFRRLTFPTILSHLVGNWYPELCLHAVDDAFRQTYPVCIAPLPLSSNSRNIGPIILPPTLSVSKGSVSKNEQLQASGKTTPDSEVEVYLARATTPRNVFTIIKEALAYYVPTYRTTSDDQGNFEFNLPNDSPNTWRIFAASKVLGASSAKSNTLTFNILSSYSSIITFILYLFRLLRPYLIHIVIFFQVLIVILLLCRLRKKKTKKRSQSLKK